MATLYNGTNLAEDFILTKQYGTILTLNTKEKYVDKNIQATFNVQSGADGANTASADADVESTAGGGGTNISAVIGTKSTTVPSSGYYIRIKASGSGSSKITTAGWLDAGNLTPASTTSVKYFPIAAATVTENTPSFNASTGLITASVTTTAGYTPADTQSATLQLTAQQPAFTGGGLSGTATATGADADISTSVNNSGVTITTACTATRAAVTYDGSVAGWVSKANGDTALASGSSALTSTTYYVNGVTLTAPSSGTRTFSITVPNGTNDEITFQFTVDANGNTTVDTSTT